jgi:hypothetical protein
MMEPWKTKHSDIIKFIIGKKHFYKIRLDIIVSKMLTKIIDINRTQIDLRKVTLQKNLTRHYLKISKTNQTQFVTI